MKIARLILFRLEERLSGNSFDLESAKYDLEHVLPENPGANWDEFDARQRAAFTYRLGNLALLKASDNRDLGNAGFSQKRPVYQASEFAITGKLAQDFDTWTVNKVHSRQRWMATQATGAWRISLLPGK